MKRVKKVLLIVLVACVLFIAKNSYAYSYMSDKTETNYGQEDGLSSIIANDIVQTNDGYIWIAQYVGLTRYNGKSFDCLDVTDNNIELTGCQALAAVDSELYIGTQKGLIKYDGEEYTKIDLLGSEFSVYDIDTVGSYVVFATSMGTYKYNRVNKDCSICNSFSSASIESIDLGVGSTIEAFYYITKDNVVYNNASASSAYYDSLEYPAKCITAVGSNVYIGSNNGHLIINKTKDVDICDGYSINDIYYYKGALYIATDNGLYYYDFNTVEEIADKLECSKSVESLFFDYEGTLWICSSETGVSKITENELMDYFYEYQVSAWFTSNGVTSGSYTVNAITKCNGLTYIATGNGLAIVNEETSEIVENDLTDLLLKVRLRDIAIFKDELYIATYGSDYDLIVWDGTNISYYDSTYLTEDGSASASAGQLRCFATTSDYLLIGTNYGITKYDGSTFTSKALDARPLYLYVNDGVIYSCMENIGVVIISDDLETQTRIDENNHPSLKVLCVDGVLFYSDASTLYYYGGDGVHTVNAKFSGTIVEILYINDTYYIGTDYEVYKLTTDIFGDFVDYEEIGTSNGLKSSLVANASGYYDEDSNSYYFAGSSGVYLYSLDSTASKTTPIKLGVDSINIDGNRVSGTTIKMSKDAKRLVIAISVLSYKVGSNYTAMYKLDGVDDDWQALRSNDSNEITYTNLNGGEYTFTFKVISSDGTQGYNTISITIIKAKHFYEQPVFWVLMIILGATVLALGNVLIIKRRTNVLKKRELEYKQITIEAMEAIARTIDAKDEYTNGHSSRVGHYAKIIATELGLSKDEVDNIYYIALLHDIGKIAVPLEILNKPGRLTDEEYEIIKTHAVKGGKILSGITTIPNIADGAKYHHERYDGKGYPEGLSGTDIPYTARIIACCDAFDAMATRRSYKEPYTKEKIIQEFEKAKGTQLDPIIATVVIDLIKNGKLEINNGFDPNLKINDVKDETTTTAKEEK